MKWPAPIRAKHILTLSDHCDYRSNGHINQLCPHRRRTTMLECGRKWGRIDSRYPNKDFGISDFRKEKLMQITRGRHISGGRDYI